MTRARLTSARRGLVIATMLGSLLAAPGRTQAQPDNDHAHAEILSAEGDKHFALTEYEAAIASYKEAYRRVAVPVLLYNIGRSYRLLGGCQQARTFFKNYLSTGAAEYKDKAEQRVLAIDAGTDDRCIAGKVVDAPTPPPTRVDPVGPVIGNTTGGTGPGTDHPAGPGPATDHPAGPGPATDHPAGPGATVDLTPPHDPGPDGSTTLHPGRGKRIAGLVTVGVGVALAGTGGYFSSQARQATRDVEQACSDGCAAADVAGKDADGKDADRNATIFYAAGGVAVAAGTAILVWGLLEGRGAEHHVALVPSRSGALAVAAWSF